MLTDKEIEDIALKYTRVCGGYEAHEDAIPDRDVIDFARAIEKAVLFDELQKWTTSRWFALQKRKMSGVINVGGCYGIILKQK